MSKVVSKTKRALVRYFFVAAFAIAAIILIYLLMNIQMDFLGSLYRSMNLIRLDVFISKFLVKKIIVSVALFILGLSCISLCYFTNDNRVFSDLGVLCFCSTGSLWRPPQKTPER